MGNINRIILALIIGLIPFLSKSQSDPDWPRFELYQLVQGTDSGQFVITAQDSNLIFTDLLKMRFFPDTALIFNGDTIAVKPDIPTFEEGLGISIEYDPVLNQYTIESLNIEDNVYNGTSSTILKGTPLYATGVQGNFWAVAPADAADPLKMPVVIIAGENIDPGEEGKGLIKGHIRQVNTTGLPSGAEVYVAAGGGYTSTKPKGENVIVQRLGTVIKGNSTNGSGIINLSDARSTSNLNPDKIFIGAADSSVTTINIKQLISDSVATKGTVSSVAATGTNGISVTGSPITTSGTLTITSNATTLNTPNTIVLRDGSGNFKAGTIEGNLAGIAREVQSLLTPGYGITPTDTYNGSIARTFNVDTFKLATLTAVRDTATSIRSAITAGVTGTFINGAVPYAASAGSALTNSGWSINSEKLMRGYGTPLYDLDVNGTIGGTFITASNRINADSILVTKGATFNTQQGSFNFRVDGNLETGLIFANASTNRVGIGLTGNPSYKLDVNGDINVSSGSVYRINGTALTGSQWVNSGSDIYYNSGEVGIGNTNPTSTLHVTGTANITDDLVVDNFTFFVDASENSVGIGTNEPISNLDVRGTANFDLATLFVQPTDNYVGVRTGNPSAALDVRGDAIFNNDGGDFDFRIEGDTEANLFFVDAGTDRIGIGTGTPGYKLDVNGDISGDNLLLFSESSSCVSGFKNSVTGTSGSDGALVGNIDNAFYVQNLENASLILATNNNPNAYGIILKNTGVVQFTAYGSGTLSTDASGNISASDGRLKTITKQLNSGLDKVLKLNPVYYKWNKDSGFNTKYQELGFIAQDVKKVIPEAVPNDETETNRLNYSDRAIIATLVKAVQEQQIQIEQLKAELKNVKKKVKTD